MGRENKCRMMGDGTTNRYDQMLQCVFMLRRWDLVTASWIRYAENRLVRQMAGMSSVPQGRKSGYFEEVAELGMMSKTMEERRTEQMEKGSCRMQWET